MTPFILRGTKEIVCTHEGRWSHPFPKCCKHRGGIGNNNHNKHKENSIPEEEVKYVPGSTLDVYELASEKKVNLFHEESTIVSCPPLEQTKNVEFECRSPNGEIHNCDKEPILPYTVAHLKCSKYTFLTIILP